MSIPYDRVKHYEILKLIGKGGMGEVYLAQDTVLDRKVAIKFLPESIKEDSKSKDRFLREAKAAAALDHPFICKIYETGKINGNAFIAMEYVEGKTLRDKLEEQPLSLRDSTRIALEIVEALETAHEKGIVHRDLKPDNIMLTPQGHVKVMDFGLAKRILPGGGALEKTLTQATFTEQGTIMGTLAYMSPEQARGEIVDNRSDIFSFGVLLHEMISGESPFSRPTPAETLSAILRDPPPPVSIKPKTVNPSIDRILQKSLAKDPTERYQKISDLSLDIRNIETETAVGPHVLFRKWPVIIGGLIIIAMLLTGILWFSRRSYVPSPEVLPEPVSVLVADFQNQTGDTVFNGALEQAMSIGLEGASFISIYQRPKARKLGNKLEPSAEGRLSAQLAQLVCRSEGINVVLDGSIEPSGAGYALKVWAIDPVSSEKIADASKTIGTKAEVLRAADSLAAQVRSKLGGIPVDSAQAISEETFTTSSLEAMNAYAHAQELKEIGRHEEAVKEYKRALEEDPNMGRCYSGLAIIYYNLGELQKAEEYFQMAMARIDRMSEREKYRTRATYYLMKLNCKKAIEELSVLVEKFPADSSAQANLAVAYYLIRDIPRAAEVGRRAIELYPKNITPRFNMVWYAMASGNFELAKQETQNVLELNPEYEEVYVNLALMETAQGRPEQAAETYRHLESLSSWGASFAATGLADIAVYEGRLADAKEILEKGIDVDLKKGRKDYAADKWAIQAHLLLLQGQRNPAQKAADRAIASSQKVGVQFQAAQIYIRTGQDNKASALAAELSNKLQPEHQAYAKLIEGELRMERDDFPGAIKLFQESQTLVDMWPCHFSLGRAYLRAEAFTEAYSEFELCLKRRGEALSIFFDDVPSCRYLPLIYYYLGQAQEGLGSPAASESYQKFLAIKERAEGDPLVEEVRRRLAAL
jgi:serine/threonine protein kinase/tetratricopeptide (TPR) repeat protein